ncbi:GTP1/Obg family GTP-binding protein [Paenibacillus turicensis]|uniref:GTP1/Obg family GTP-binding protein n=1 Tax=Paenibacillus turicensis TaxID=160487 RepID=A0ABS4FRX5_9BACL|nr:hypothetical protein [Paenibacillus turicensis]MBP1905305.1 GTP1/Obg family GTP-binding protein [Paenibacillus turicensis]
MYVIESNARVDLTYQEMSDIAFDIKRALMVTAETHWVTHAKDKDAFEFAEYVLEKEAERVKKIHFFSRVVGLRNDLRSDLVLMYKRIKK